MNPLSDRRARWSTPGVLLAVALGLTQASLGHTAPAVQAPPMPKVTYMDYARTAALALGDGDWMIDLIAPAKLLPGQSAFDLGEGWGDRTIDCSTATYRCVRVMGWWTLAVPRHGLNNSSRYIVDKTAFRVEKCLRGSGTVCQIALIGARCDRISIRHGNCVLTPPAGKPRPKDGYTIYFVYNEDYGITAMGVAAHGLTSFQAKQSVLTQLVLVAKRGLLAPGSTPVSREGP